MAHIIGERGILFALDVSIAYIITLAMIVLAFVTTVQLSELRSTQMKLFEQERGLLLADALLKRGTDENGLAMVSQEQKRVLENVIDETAYTAGKLNRLFIANRVSEVSLQGKRLFKFEFGGCKNTLVVKRGVTYKGAFAVLKVRFCYD